jgi:hypothetical protein
MQANRTTMAEPRIPAKLVAEAVVQDKAEFKASIRFWIGANRQLA